MLSLDLKPRPDRLSPDIRQGREMEAGGVLGAAARRSPDGAGLRDARAFPVNTDAESRFVDRREAGARAEAQAVRQDA